MGCVSAANETDVLTDDADSADDALSVEPAADVSGQGVEDETLGDADPIQTNIKSDDTNIIKGNDFSAVLTDGDSKPLANKNVRFTINNVESNHTTDANGVARLKVDVEPGTYTVNYSFAEDGYVACQNSTDILVISTSASKIKAKNYTAYVGAKNPYSIKLKAGDIPLANRNVTFKINGKTYVKTTDSNGVAKLNIKLGKGTYKLSYSYDGEKNIKGTSGTVIIKVKKGMPTKISKYYSTTYRNNKKAYFKIKLTDSRGNPLKNKKIIYKINGKKYAKRTNSKGIVSIKIKLRMGTYKLKCAFGKTSVYKKATKTFKINVKSSKKVNGGMWLFGRDMKSVNLANLQKNGFKHVFLNFKALELYGKSGVESWIKKASARGIKVHMWMQVFYNGGWINPVSNGKINYNLINSKVKEAVKYAKIKGVAGVHMDYVRYPGTASKYPNSVNAVNHFVKQVAIEVHKVNKKLIVSAAVMPEPSSMKSAYAQDIKFMGKYLDAIVPMVYKGNYHAGTSWIKSVTSTFDKQSSKAQIWTGLQSYRSDSNVAKIPAKELANDARASIQAGANGVILFRYGLFNFINFKGL